MNISAPHMHSKVLELLKDHLSKAKKCLDIGSGSGYLTLALQKMMPENGVVYGVDHIPELVQNSINNISKNHKEVLEQGRIVFASIDGRQGWSDHAPYDVIHVGAAVESLPKEFLEQLNKGGRMVVPVGKQGSQELTVIDKDS